MAKELPYFQFEPAAYLTGNIQFCSYEEQGVFVNICAIYWQRSCEISQDQLVRKFGDAVHRLIAEDVIKCNEGKIIIEFLDEQWNSITASKKRLSEAGKKGAEIKKEATLKPPLSQAETPLKQLDKIREEEIRKEENREDNIKKYKDAFLQTLQPYKELYSRNMLNAFYSYWTEPNKSMTKIKWQLEKTWDVKQRLRAWASRDIGFIKEKNIKSKSEEIIESNRKVHQMIDEKYGTGKD